MSYLKGFLLPDLNNFRKSHNETVNTTLIGFPLSTNYDWRIRRKLLHSRNNIIANSVEALDGAEAICLSACDVNNVIRQNYIHDISIDASAAICADTLTRYTRVNHNLFYNLAPAAIALNDANNVSNYHH